MTLHRLTCLVLLLALLPLRPAAADLIVFLDGRTLEGEIVGDDGEYYTIQGRFGKTKILKREVREIQKVLSPREEFESRQATLEKSEKQKNADAWADLAKFAASKQLDQQAKAAWEHALKCDEDHLAAREALGFVRYLGAWVPLEEKMKAEGKVKHGERWVTPEEAQAQDAPAIKLETPPTPVPGEVGAAAAAAQPQPCAYCKATGFARWFPCQECKSSGKPGYVNLGERHSLCPRCAGRGELPALRCVRCNGAGRVEPQYPRTAGGIVVPRGYKECAPCNGTGGADFKECPRCVKTRPRGFLNFGDRFEPCSQCGGEAKVPTKRCPTCAGAQVVKSP
ncbi:MAG: hypothetical protein M5U26_30665 [Planctomycetota bacterium]|nr:hypothetical protein [Planctomycetota bacterium]